MRTCNQETPRPEVDNQKRVSGDTVEEERVSSTSTEVPTFRHSASR